MINLETIVLKPQDLSKMKLGWKYFLNYCTLILLQLSQLDLITASPCHLVTAKFSIHKCTHKHYQLFERRRQTLLGCLWVSDCSALSLVFVQGTDTERGFTKLIQSYTKHKGIKRNIKLIQAEFHKSDTKVHKTTSNLTQLIVGKQIVSQRSLTEAFFVPDLFFTRSIFFFLTFIGLKGQLLMPNT